MKQRILLLVVSLLALSVVGAAPALAAEGLSAQRRGVLGVDRCEVFRLWSNRVWRTRRAHAPRASRRVGAACRAA